MSNNSSKNREFNHFSKIAKEWWIPNGKFKILHEITPLRIKYILKMINQKKIIDEIFLIVKDISIKNNIKLVLNEDQYFISSEKNDISQLVLSQLNSKKLNLEIIYEK